MDNPLQRVKNSVAGLIEVMPQHDLETPYVLVSDAYTRLRDAFDSPEFRRYRESFGKVSLMAIGKGQSDVIFQNFAEVLKYWDKINDGILSRRKISFLDVACLYTRLGVMLEHQEVIDEAFKQP